MVKAVDKKTNASMLTDSRCDLKPKRNIDLAPDGDNIYGWYPSAVPSASGATTGSKVAGRRAESTLSIQ